MSSRTLFSKIWDDHIIADLGGDTALLHVDRHLLHDLNAMKCLQELRERYTDCLAIIDLPPVLLADDVLTIAPLLDGVLLVVSEGRTKREDVLRLRELLQGVHVLGTVLNVSSESEQRGY